MRKFLPFLFTASLLFTSLSCNVNKGLTGGISPAKALSGVQALLGGTTSSVLNGFTGDILSNPIMQSVLPKELTTLTSVLGKSNEGAKVLGLVNGALSSVVPNVAGSVLADATKNISPNDALSLLNGGETGATAVSYTHLTLPTIYSV